jgi:hypothetical protein
MNSTTTSGIGGSGECSGSDVTTIETVTVCTIDRRKTGNQNPKCTVTRVRVLNKSPGKSDTEPSEVNEPPTPEKREDQTGSAGAKNEDMCPLPSREMTAEEEEAAMIDCLGKARDKEVGGTAARRHSDHGLNGLKSARRKGFKPRTP